MATVPAAGAVVCRRVAGAIRGPILAIDPAVADTWGLVMARSEKAGRMLGSMDAFVAATAEVHALTLLACYPKISSI